MLRAKPRPHVSKYRFITTCPGEPPKMKLRRIDARFPIPSAVEADLKRGCVVRLDYLHAPGARKR